MNTFGRTSKSYSIIGHELWYVRNFIEAIFHRSDNQNLSIYNVKFIVF